jgi:putative membrane protein
MKNVTRIGLAAGLAGALALFGSARAQSSTSGSGTGSGSTGSPSGVGAGDTTRGDTGAPGSQGSSATGSTGSSSMGTGTGSSDTATGGSGASAGTGGTASGAPSAGKKLDKKLQDRLEKLHAGNQGEIQAAQVAMQSAQSPDVKQFAQQMQTDHQAMDQKLTDQAQTMGVSLEGKTFQKEQQSAQKDMQKFQSKTGADFDKAYMGQMVKDHEKDLKEVKGAAKDAQKSHPELASALQGAQSKIQSHLDQAKQVQKSLGKGGGTASSGSSGSSSMGTGSSGSSGTKDTSKVHSGSRGDTGGPSPSGSDRGSGTGSTGSTTSPGGGEQGTSSGK